MIKYIQSISDKILESSSFRTKIQDFVMSDFIATFKDINGQKPKILVINPRESLDKVFEFNKAIVKKMFIGANKSDIGSDDLLSMHINGEKFDYVLFDSCLQYFKHPDDVLEDALLFSKSVRIVLINYGSIKYRLHFLTHGTWDFIDKTSGIFNSKIVSPFGIGDFYNLCNRKHFYITSASYINKKGSERGVFSSTLSPNLHLNDGVFDIEKIV